MVLVKDGLGVFVIEIGHNGAHSTVRNRIDSMLELELQVEARVGKLNRSGGTRISVGRMEVDLFSFCHGWLAMPTLIGWTANYAVSRSLCFLQASQYTFRENRQHLQALESTNGRDLLAAYSNGSHAHQSSRFGSYGMKIS